MKTLLGLAALTFVSNLALPDQSKHSDEFRISDDIQNEWGKKFLQDDVTKTSSSDHPDTDNLVY